MPTFRNRATTQKTPPDSAQSSTRPSAKHSTSTTDLAVEAKPPIESRAQAANCTVDTPKRTANKP
ncbi:hypothetical protein SAMN03159300_10484 [Janthinobacterium sp. 344]|nr:hypothetical protein SAMN03159300_10484 [Janthinobacterium sp. 344]